MGNLDLRTEKQREREKQHERICKAYEQLKQKNPGAKPWSIFNALSKETGFTSVWIAQVCKKNGVYAK